MEAPFFKFILVSLCGTFVASTSSDHQQIRFSDPHKHREILDPEGNYLLEWFVDWSAQLIYFHVEVNTLGYVGLGLSTNGQFEGGDIVIGGLDSGQQYQDYFGDYHGISSSGIGSLERDPVQNWNLLGVWENGSSTVLSISRKFNTCDKDDISINDNSRYILWSYGDTDNFAEFPGENFGAFLTYLRDPELTPWSIVDFNRRLEEASPEVNDGVLRWNMEETFELMNKSATRWCKIKKFSLASRHHIIGQNVRINPEAKGNVHQILLFRCRPPTLITPYFDQLSLKPGEECFDLMESTGQIPTPFCSELKAIYGHGQQSFFTPSHVGIPIGDRSTTEYFLLQVHYDNPTNLENITVKMDIINLYYTDKLRDKEASLLGVGHTFPGYPSGFTPVDSKEYGIYGHCSGTCTQKMFPPGGVRVVAAFLHAHSSGQKLKLQHFRNGTELPWIISDDNYQIGFQSMRLLRDEVLLLPGDQLTMSCEYNAIREVTPDQEIVCAGWVMVYDKVNNYPFCRSEVSLMDAFGGNQLTLEQKTSCPSANQLIAKELGLIDTPPSETIKYPVNATVYRPPEQCQIENKTKMRFPEYWNPTGYKLVMRYNFQKEESAPIVFPKD